MKPILCSLLVATLPFGGALADAPRSKNAKVTLVYQHELPNVPGKSIKGVLVEYGPGGYSPGHTHPKSAFIYATMLEGAIRSQVNDGPVTIYNAGQSFSELPGYRFQRTIARADFMLVSLPSIISVRWKISPLTTAVLFTVTRLAWRVPLT